MIQISSQYHRDVSYHNDLHGSDVAQHCSMILEQQKLTQYAKLDNLDVLSILVAALCSSVGHDGYNNSYHKLNKTALYRVYNDSQT